MQPEPAKRLIDALRAARRIREFTAGVDRKEFVSSELVRAAVERQFEIVSEALGRASELDPDVGTRLPELRRIVGLRNRLIHGYDDVDDEIVWDIVQTKIAPLESQLEQLLGDAGFPID